MLGKDVNIQLDHAKYDNFLPSVYVDILNNT
jgi:hypothetical protein